MKVTVEMDIEVVMGHPASRTGTGLQGYLPKGTRYEEIVAVFGAPQLGESDDHKVKAEWYGILNGLVFTIYDYKSDVAPERNTEWHIGGNQRMIADLVAGYFREALKGRG